MDASYKVTLFDIGLVVEKLMGNGYLSDYSKFGSAKNVLREALIGVVNIIIYFDL